MRSLPALALVLLLPLGACEPAAEPCSTELPVCDAYEAACQEQMLDALACMQSGTTTDLMGSVEVWSPERAQQEVAGMATMLTEEQLTQLTRQAAALALFRLAPEDWDPATSASEYISTVAAFYQPGMQSIVIIAEPEPVDAGVAAGVAVGGTSAPPPDTEDATDAEADAEAQTRLMAHELTHMLRDAETGIGSFYARAGTTLDRQLVARAIVEGEAQLYAELAVLEQQERELDGAALAQSIESWKHDSLVAFEQVSAPVALADRYLPYPHGFAYALSAYLQGGRRAIDALFDDPPSSTRQLTLGFGAAEPHGGAWSEDDTLADVASPLAPARYEALGVFYMGAWIVDAFVQRVLPTQTHDLSFHVLSALRSDALTLLHDATTDLPAATWRLRFASEASASAMSTLATWPDHIAVRVEGRDVIFTAAASADTRVELAALAFGPAAAATPASTTTTSGLPYGLHSAWVAAATPSAHPRR